MVVRKRMILVMNTVAVTVSDTLFLLNLLLPESDSVSLILLIT